MTKLAISAVLLFFFTLSISAQSEYQMVEKTLNYYLIGGTNNDFDMLKKAFHETASMKYIDEQYTEVSAITFFRKGMRPGPPQKRLTRISSINISGPAANARLEIEYPTFTFIDYMNLLKINGEWKIVNKIFYKQMKGEQ